MATGKMWSILMTETLMRKYPDPDTFPFKSWSYPQGFMLWGMVRLWETTGNRVYYDYVFKFVDKHVDEQGNLPAFAGDSMDDIMAGSVIVWAYQQTGLEKYKTACDTIRKAFDTYPRTADGAFWHNAGWHRELWVDGLFMGQMFLSKYGRYIGDSAYCFREAAKQMRLVFRHCQKGNTGLMYHAWSEDRLSDWADQDTGLSSEVWSEGLGWYAMILVEALAVFPQDHPEKPCLVQQLKMLLADLKITQDQKTGLWYQVVDKGNLPDNWCDTSGSAMFVYTIAKAVELGLADADVYLPVAQKGYAGMIAKAKINDQRLLDLYDACDGLCVQKNYADYINYEKTVNAKEAVGAFLWATVIMEKPEKQAPNPLYRD
jgi:rhamnogalacturonyl hydrolase YesR